MIVLVTIVFAEKFLLCDTLCISLASDKNMAVPCSHLKGSYLVYMIFL